MQAEQEYDLVIIGGGISGLGVASAACVSGLKACLIERDTLCSATSANSLRIIHGGIRYLQQLNLARVIRSCRAQASLIEQYPDLIQPLRCYMPLARVGVKSKLPISSAIIIYNLLRSICDRQGLLSNARVLSDSPQESLAALAPHGLLEWTDAQVSDPALLASRIQKEIEDSGGDILENCAVQNVTRGSFGFQVDTPSQSIFAQKVVCTTGPWLLSAPWRNTLATELPMDVKWCRGFNFCLSKQVLGDFALGLQSNSGRLLFITPRASGTAVGTWYLPENSDPHDSSISEQELESALTEFNQTLPGANVCLADVRSVESGLLPATGVCGADPKLVGSERVYSDRGYVEVLSTKYTTFQVQGQEVIKRL